MEPKETATDTSRSWWNPARKRFPVASPRGPRRDRVGVPWRSEPAHNPYTCASPYAHWRRPGWNVRLGRGSPGDTVAMRQRAQRALDVTQALPLRALGEHHTQELIPAGKALHVALRVDRKSTRLNSSHLGISYAVFCLKKKKKKKTQQPALTEYGRNARRSA